MPTPPIYPEIEPHTTGMLKVDDLHSIYWERSGNPKGVPVVYTHGGPGGRTAPGNRRTFDPDFFDIVMFDQRGAGKSMPNAEIRNNTTQHVLADYEAIRRHLGIEKWLVTGGSWSSFTSLAYGAAHPERCLGIIVRGIFTGGEDELEWWWQGQKNFFPERWHAFAEFIPEAERGDLLRAYYKRAMDPDPAIHMPAAVALATYSCFTTPFREDSSALPQMLEPAAALPLIRFWTHYGVNKFFVPPGYIMRGVPKLRHLPGIIVQGRYDVTTRPLIAWKLSSAWPEAEFVSVLEAGHKSLEPTLAAALTSACDRMKGILDKQGIKPKG